MATILSENVTNYIWQAFDALQPPAGEGYVPKSRLKVLTANIGTLLDLYGIERGLEHYRSTPTLTFDQYRYYLQKEVFASLPAHLPLAEQRAYETRIAEVCWLICRRKLIQRANKILDDDAVYQIYRVFSVLAELLPSDNDPIKYQVLLHASEACNLTKTLAQSLGCSWDEEDFADLSISMGTFPLSPFVAIIESRCFLGVKDTVAIKEAVHDLYQTMVEDVLKKGYLSKKGYVFPAMREFWFVLRPAELSYYKTRTEKDRCGTLPISANSRIEAKAGTNRIILNTPERAYELEASDHMSRLQWMAALRLAVDYSAKEQSYQRLQAQKRRLQRQGRIEEMIRARAQLQKEKRARQQAEGQAKQLEAAVQKEAKKLSEMEELRLKLERLLEEETQAKRDEEIVRALQARVLNEEWEKREELERLQEEQKALLEEERGKRLEYEELQQEKETQLRSAEKRLEQLEKERRMLDEELKVAHEKIRNSEEKKEVLEARLYQMAPNLRDGDRVRRAHSFIPSTKERPILVQVRASTLKRPPK